MKLNTDQWKDFSLKKLFKIRTTKLSIRSDLENGNIPFISRTAMNNGCDGHVSVSEEDISKGGCLTVGAEGIYSFYQPIDFATGNKVYTLKNSKLNIFQYLFISTVLNKEDYKYNYGRARIKSKLENEVIKLPIQYEDDGNPVIDKNCIYSDKGYVPDWLFMEKYIKSIHYKPITTKNIINNDSDPLATSDWQKFKIGDLFTIKTGKDFIYNDATGDDYPVIGQGAENNGIACRTEKVSDYVLQDASKTLSMAHIGNFIAFVQPTDFYLGTRTKALISKEPTITNKQLMFIATIINKEQYRFSYGRVGSDKLPYLEIKLPIRHNSDGHPIIDKDKLYSVDGYIPDWDFMENYMMKLPYGDRI